MPLTGQAKTDYQREYMRRRRAETVRPVSVRPSVRPEQGVTVRPKMVRPPGISDWQWAYIQSKAEHYE